MAVLWPPSWIYQKVFKFKKSSSPELLVKFGSNLVFSIDSMSSTKSSSGLSKMAVFWPPSWINKKSIKIFKNILLQNGLSHLVQIGYLSSTQCAVQNDRGDCQTWPYFGRHLGLTKKASKYLINFFSKTVCQIRLTFGIYYLLNE